MARYCSDKQPVEMIVLYALKEINSFREIFLEITYFRKRNYFLEINKRNYFFKRNKW